MRIIARIVITLCSIGLIAVHIFLPIVKIDSTVIVLFVIAILPWLAPILARLRLPTGIKSIEFPGGFKIEATDIKDQIEKIILPSEDSKWRLGHEDIGRTGSYDKQKPKEEPFPSFVTADPNLALIWFRIEIEKRLRKLAEVKGLNPELWSPSKLIEKLESMRVISGAAMIGLTNLISLGNKATHGQTAAPEIADVVWREGLSVLKELDSIIGSA